MYSIVPFAAGAVIAVGILSAFAPGGTFTPSDSAIIAHASATPSGNSTAGSAPAGKSGPSDIKGGGSSDGSTGPNRPNANTADNGDANKAVQDKLLREQQPGRTDHVQPAPTTK